MNLESDNKMFGIKRLSLSEHNWNSQIWKLKTRNTVWPQIDTSDLGFKY